VGAVVAIQRQHVARQDEIERLARLSRRGEDGAAIIAREPFSFGAAAWKSPIDEILGCWTDFAKVGHVSAPLRLCNNQAFLFHQPLHHFLRDGTRCLASEDLQPAVAVAAMIRLKDGGDGLPNREVLVAHSCTGPMVEVRATGKTQLGKELWQSIVLPEGVNQQAPSPIHALFVLQSK
jgi:hypothetical protein